MGLLDSSIYQINFIIKSSSALYERAIRIGIFIKAGGKRVRRWNDK